MRIKSEKISKLILVGMLPTISTIALSATSCGQDQWNKTYDSYVSIHASKESSLELINYEGNNPDLKYSFNNKNWNKYKEAIDIPTNATLYLIGNNKSGWSKSFGEYSNLIIKGKYQFQEM